jgi:hypothetical protein
MWITVRLRNVVSSRPGRGVVFRPSCKRHGPELCPGPRGAALLWACPQQAPSSSAPYPLEGPVHGLCPRPRSGKRRARQLRRNTLLRAGSSSRGSPPNPEQARGSSLSSRSCSACCCLSRRLPSLLPLDVRTDAAACQIPTCGAVGLPTLARPGEGKNPRCTIRKGCLRKGVLCGADDLRLSIPACRPAASRPGRAG